MCTPVLTPNGLSAHPLKIAAPWAQGCSHWPGSGYRTRQAWEVGFWLFEKETQGLKDPGNRLEAGVLALALALEKI